MAIRDHVDKTVKLRAKITTVDPAQQIIECVTKDGQARRLFISDIPGSFTWPKVNEEWSIYYESGYPRLGNRYELQDDLVKVSQLQPGDSYIAETIIPDGHRLLVYNPATMTVGNTMVWNGTSWVPVVPVVPPKIFSTQLFRLTAATASTTITLPFAGSALIHFGGTCFRATSGFLALDLSIDGVYADNAFANAVGNTRRTVAMCHQRNMTAGSHTFALGPSSGFTGTTTDANDAMWATLILTA